MFVFHYLGFTQNLVHHVLNTVQKRNRLHSKEMELICFRFALARQWSGAKDARIGAKGGGSPAPNPTVLLTNVLTNAVTLQQQLHGITIYTHRGRCFSCRKYHNSYSYELCNAKIARIRRPRVEAAARTRSVLAVLAVLEEKALASRGRLNGARPAHEAHWPREKARDRRCGHGGNQATSCQQLSPRRSYAQTKKTKRKMRGMKQMTNDGPNKKQKGSPFRSSGRGYPRPRRGRRAQQTE